MKVSGRQRTRYRGGTTALFGVAGRPCCITLARQGLTLARRTPILRSEAGMKTLYLVGSLHANQNKE